MNKENQKKSKSYCHSSETICNWFFWRTDSADNEGWHCQQSRKDLGTGLGKVSVQTLWTFSRGSPSDSSDSCFAADLAALQLQEGWAIHLHGSRNRKTGKQKDW